jgi:hypothetical protein
MCGPHGTHQIMNIIQVLALQRQNNKYINKKYQINIINNLRPTRHANTNNLNTIRGPHGARNIINKYNNINK